MLMDLKYCDKGTLVASSAVLCTLAFRHPAPWSAAWSHLSECPGHVDCRSCNEMLCLPADNLDWRWRGLVAAAGSGCVLCGVC